LSSNLTLGKALVRVFPVSQCTIKTYSRKDKRRYFYTGGGAKGGTTDDYSLAIVEEKFQGIQSDGLFFTPSA